jgi:hypothetical protein
MKPHKRNGKAARIRRQQSAAARKERAEIFWANHAKMSPEERLLVAIFGVKQSDFVKKA